MNNVRYLREQRGLTQDDFSEMCDVPRISIARYETGDPISRKNAQKIASACKVSIDFVIGTPGAEEAPDAPVLDEALVNMLVTLRPTQVQRVKDFVEGIKAADKG